MYVCSPVERKKQTYRDEPTKMKRTKAKKNRRKLKVENNIKESFLSVKLNKYLVDTDKRE